MPVHILINALGFSLIEIELPSLQVFSDFSFFSASPSLEMSDTFRIMIVGDDVSNVFND